MSIKSKYFDARKGATETYAKSAFKQMMYSGTALTTNGTKVFDAIWNNIGSNGNNGLRENLFPRANYPNMNDIQYKDAARLDFITFIDKTNNSFYNFIKAK